LPQTISGIIPTPNSGLCNTAFLGKVELTIPPHIAGIQKFSVRYILYRLKAGQFAPRAVVSTKKFTLNIIATPIYRIFLSRGIGFEDRIVGDSIAQMIREWGLFPITVGINISAPEFLTNEIINSEIQNSAGLIAIATPRILDENNHTYKTLEWLHSETGTGICSTQTYNDS
jgi:hypothetical protein